MAVYKTNELLAQLASELTEIMHTLDTLRQEDVALLAAQPSPGRWSVAQVLEHLNSYNRYYLPEMERAIANTQAAPSPTFRPGWLGNYFTKSMYSNVPAASEITNKMKAPKEHSPVPALDVKAVIAEFCAGHRQLLDIMSRARQTDIGAAKVPISIARWIKLSLGDTLRFLIAHQVRHFLQVRNTMSEVSGKSLLSPVAVGR